VIVVTAKQNRLLHARLVYDKKYKKKHPKEIAKYQKAYRTKHKHKLNKQINDKYHAERMAVLRIYSKGEMKCACKGCHVKDTGQLVIEHVKGKKSLGHQNMSNPSYYNEILSTRPKGLKVYCQRCNASKRDTGKCHLHN